MVRHKSGCRPERLRANGWLIAPTCPDRDEVDTLACCDIADGATRVTVKVHGFDAAGNWTGQLLRFGECIGTPSDLGVDQLSLAMRWKAVRPRTPADEIEPSAWTWPLYVDK